MAYYVFPNHREFPFEERMRLFLQENTSKFTKNQIRSLKKAQKRFKIENNQLFVKKNKYQKDGSTVVVPVDNESDNYRSEKDMTERWYRIPSQTEILDTIRFYHGYLHNGREEMRMLLKEEKDIWIPHFDEIYENFVQTCEFCNTTKENPPGTLDLSSYEYCSLVPEPFEYIFLDVTYKENYRGFKYVLTAVEPLSKVSNKYFF